MPLRDINAEDIALLAAIGMTGAAVLIEEVYGSTAFKALKIFGVVVSLGLAIHRIRTGKPYVKDVSSESWVQVGGSYQVKLPKSEHSRGKHATARCLSKAGDGSYHECSADAANTETGDLIIHTNQPVAIRVEVRKG